MSRITQLNIENPPELVKNELGAETEGQLYKFNVPLTALEPIKVTAPNGEYFSWKPTELLYKDELGIEDYIIESMPSELSILGRQARYLRTFANADDVFLAEKDKVKHWTVLNEPPRVYAEYLGNGVKFGISGLISGTALPKGIFESIEQGMFNLPKPVITDLIGQEVEAYYEVTDSEQGQILYIWFDAEYLKQAVYPIMVDPTVIVASATSVTARPVILDNAWYVVAVNNTSSVDFYVSKDRGTSWQLLTSSTFSASVIASSIVSRGNNIYCAIATATKSYFLKFDASTVVNAVSDFVALPGSLTDYRGAKIALNQSGVIYIVYTAWGTVYPGSGYFELACRSTDNGNSFTQMAIEGAGYTGFNIKGFDLAIKSDGYPIAIFAYDDIYGVESPDYPHPVTYTHTVKAKVWNGSSWSTNIVYSYDYVDSDVYMQESPSIAVDASGIAHVAWAGSIGGKSAKAIRYAKSKTLACTTWTAMNELVYVSGTAQDKPSVGIDSDHGKVYVYFQGGSTVYRIVHDGVSWGTKEQIAGGTNPLVANYLKLNAMPFVYQSGGVVFDQVLFNVLPTAPTNLARSNFNALNDADFSWTFNDQNSFDKQSAYQLQIIDVSSGAVVKDTGKVLSSNSSYTLPGGTLTNLKQYQWKVTTWDSMDMQGAWSSLATFQTLEPPTVSITNPTDGTVLTANTITVNWTFSDAGGGTQSKYQVKLTDGNDNVIYSSGIVSDASARSLAVPYTLLNNQTYKLKVSVWNSFDVESSEVSRTFSTSFTQPAKPVIYVSSDNIRGSIRINIINPIPTGTQPSVSYIDIYRDGKRIATGITDNTFVDYAPQAGKLHEYKVIGIGGNNTVIESNTEYATAYIGNVQIALTSDYSQYIDLVRNQSKEQKLSLQSVYMQFAGRSKAVIEYGEHETNDLALSFIVDYESLEKLKDLIYGKETLLYRDSRGRKIFVAISNLDIKDEYPGYYAVSFEPSEVSYSEVV